MPPVIIAAGVGAAVSTGVGIALGTIAAGGIGSALFSAFLTSQVMGAAVNPPMKDSAHEHS